MSNGSGHTSKLRKSISDFFKNIEVEAYYFEASAGANFPYIAYELRHLGNVLDAEEAKRYMLEIEAYGKESISQLDDLLDLLEKELAGHEINNQHLYLRANLAYGRMDIRESDPLKRKRINFELKVYEKEN